MFPKVLAGLSGVGGLGFGGGDGAGHHTEAEGAGEWPGRFIRTELAGDMSSIGLTY